jgi:hypothetical protein
MRLLTAAAIAKEKILIEPRKLSTIAMQRALFLARFAPYVFFVPFVVDCLEFCLRVLRMQPIRLLV